VVTKSNLSARFSTASSFHISHFHFSIDWYPYASPCPCMAGNNDGNLAGESHAQYTPPTSTPRDETVELRRVGGVYRYMNSQPAHDDCRRIRRCEHSRWPWPSLQFCSQWQYDTREVGYDGTYDAECLYSLNIRISCVVWYSWIFITFSTMTSLL